jgi:ribosomal protein S17E
MEEKVKIQHYVPRTYLKNFSSFNGGEYYIWVFDKLTEKVFQTNIKNIAFEEEFYNKVSEEQTTEKTLRDIETKFDIVAQKLISVKDLDMLIGEEKDVLAEFIAYQMIRTKGVREEIKDIPKQLLEKYGDNMNSNFKEQVVDSMTKDSLRKMQNNIIGNIEVFKKRIKNLKWIVSINKTKFPFWTSDNPVIEYNEIDLFPYGNLGLDCFGFEMHFPINTMLTLTICDNRRFIELPSKEIIKDYRRIVRERDLQVGYSTRFIFSIDNNFSFAQMKVRENPLIKDPNRKRVTIN